MQKRQVKILANWEKTVDIVREKLPAKKTQFTDFETIPKTPSLKGTISSSATDKPMAKNASKSTLKTPNLILKQQALKGNCKCSLEKNEKNSMMTLSI